MNIDNDQNSPLSDGPVEGSPREVATEREGGLREAGGEASNVTSSDVNMDTLLKVPVSLSIEVGRTRMSINDIMNTHEGSVIELERLLEEPLDILVNGALIAHGVVVLANDRFGIQITDIISPHERVRTI